MMGPEERDILERLAEAIADNEEIDWLAFGLDPAEFVSNPEDQPATALAARLRSLSILSRVVGSFRRQGDITDPTSPRPTPSEATPETD